MIHIDIIAFITATVMQQMEHTQQTAGRDRRERRVNLRLTTAEHAQFVTAARGQDVSTWLREIALGQTSVAKADPARALALTQRLESMAGLIDKLVDGQAQIAAGVVAINLTLSTTLSPLAERASAHESQLAGLRKFVGDSLRVQSEKLDLIIKAIT